MNSKPFPTVPTSPFVCTRPYATIANTHYTDSPVGKTEGTKLWSMRKARENFYRDAAALRTIERLELLAD